MKASEEVIRMRTEARSVSQSIRDARNSVGRAHSATDDWDLRQLLQIAESALSLAENLAARQEEWSA